MSWRSVASIADESQSELKASTTSLEEEKVTTAFEEENIIVPEDQPPEQALPQPLPKPEQANSKMSTKEANGANGATRASVVERAILKADGQTVDCAKIVAAMWNSRNNAKQVCQLSDTLCKFLDEKRVFLDLEFYLPQLAHLVIHLEGDSFLPSFELLLISLCQTSMHIALQLYFILLAAIEDYEPEDSQSMANETANLDRFFRCTRMLNDLERAVIYGTPALTTTEESKLLDHISEDKMTELYEGDRVRRATALVPKAALQVPGPTGGSTKSGTLLYKRIERKSRFHSKKWKPRFFSVQQRMFNCYHDEGATVPMRAVCLPDSLVEVSEGSKYEFAFSVTCHLTGNVFQLRAPDQAAFNSWMSVLKEESERPPVDLLPRAASVDEESGINAESVLDSKNIVTAAADLKMTSSQRKRFKFFQHERQFISALTQICDELRFVDRDVRKHMLKQKMRTLIIPPFVYLPLCSSLDPYRCIVKALPEEGHAFTTKARCPALMLFETEEHPAGLDIATFLQAELHEYDDEEISISDRHRSESLDAATLGHFTPSLGEAVVVGDVEPKKSVFTHAEDVRSSLVHRGVWKKAGAGMSRVSLTGPLEIEDMEEPVAETVAEPEMSAPTGETYSRKSARVKAKSAYGSLSGWRMGGLIAKSNDDVRQEVFVMQLIKFFKKVFEWDNVPVYLYTYGILSASKTTGLIELIPNSSSLDGLKKSEGYPGSLRGYFEATFGAPTEEKFKTAVSNYVKSMAGYSIVTYLLAIKDRHNGNIMLDHAGHVIHIDFGFVFGLAPGKQASLEKAPWKLTQEMADVMSGLNSAYFAEYKKLCAKAFISARKHADKFCTLFEIMAHESNYPAFKYNAHWISDFRAKLVTHIPDADIGAEIDRLVAKSYRHTGTGLYDRFQLATNGIAV